MRKPQRTQRRTGEPGDLIRGFLAGELSWFWLGANFGGDILRRLGWGGEAAQRQSGESEQELDAVAQFQLRLAIETRREHHRYLEYLRAMAHEFKQDGGLKGITARGQRAEITAAKEFGGEGAIAGRAIFHRSYAAA